MHITKPTLCLLIAALTLSVSIGASAQTERILYSFDGESTQAGLISDSRGNLYGTTPGGGSSNVGTVFELTPNSNGTWTQQVIYSFGFTFPGDGLGPYGPLCTDKNGNLYGTTAFGGTNLD